MITVGKTGRTRLTGDELTVLRSDCFERDHHRCVDCGRKVYWETFEMAHLTSRGACGSDTLDNVVTKCGGCHRGEHHPRVIATKP